MLGCASAAVLAEGLLAAVEGGDLFGAGAQRLGEGSGLQHPHAPAQREQARKQHFARGQRCLGEQLPVSAVAYGAHA